MCKCPSCDSSYRRRVPRNLFLKLIPKAKLYKCYRCKSKYLFIPYLVPPILLLKKSRIVEEVEFSSKELIVD